MAVPNIRYCLAADPVGRPSSADPIVARLHAFEKVACK